LSSVASRTTRRAFWLLSRNLHLCSVKDTSSNALASTRFCNSGGTLNCRLQDVHTAMIGIRPSDLTTLSARFGILTVSHRSKRIAIPVQIKRHHYREIRASAAFLETNPSYGKLARTRLLFLFPKPALVLEGCRVLWVERGASSSCLTASKP
jgi:hypothetical protein